VIETIQDFDANGATLFDEPVGIAFASNTKAYVALSSRNDIAVVDAVNYEVTGRLHVTAQDPRAIAVRDGLLYVAAFESGNKSEISACNQLTGSLPPQCTLSLQNLFTFVTNPNIPGTTKNIVIDPEVPDRDLFVYRTDTDALVTALQSVGTLLYGVAVGPAGKVFVTQTDARNDVNGLQSAGELVALGNRMFLDEVATTTCTVAGCGAVTIRPLHPAPPAQPAPGTELATPYGVAVSGDGSTVVGTAAGTSRLFTMNATTGAVLGRVDLGAGASFGQQIPKGVALASGGGGSPATAYVLNTLENTVSVVNVSNPAAPALVGAKINVGTDPTPVAVRRGNIAFNNAFASTSGTFSCGSCHPDAHTDQLLWRIGGQCFLSGCDTGDEPRTTMPIRGLKNTVPLHWDGTLGDPFDNTGNGAVGVAGSVPASCSTADGDQHDCFLDLVEGSLSAVMCDQNPATNPAGCPSGGNELSASERDDLAVFLASVSYPPARSRRMNDTLSRVSDPNPVQVGTIAVSAHEGFKDFFTDQGGGTNPDTCAESNAGCHALPLGAATNSATLNGFESPTMRGMTDRFVQFSLGVTAAEELQRLVANPGLDLRPLLNFFSQPLEAPIQYDAAKGLQEITVFGTAFVAFEAVYGSRPLNMFQMFEEAGTQFPGATGRQVTLNERTTGGGLLADTENMMNALEEADFDGLVNLRAVGVRNGAGVVLSYRSEASAYRNQNDTLALSHAQLLAEAQAGTTTVTLTGALRSGYGSPLYPQPLLSTATVGIGATGDPPLPNITTGGANPPAFSVRGVDVRSDAVVLVNGVQVAATLSCTAGTSGSFCVAPGGYTGSGGSVSIDLAARPTPDGLYLLQVQNGPGPLSNELPICVGAASGCR
jgi:hypothetical protein